MNKIYGTHQERPPQDEAEIVQHVRESSMHGMSTAVRDIRYRTGSNRNPCCHEESFTLDGVSHRFTHFKLIAFVH